MSTPLPAAGPGRSRTSKDAGSGLPAGPSTADGRSPNVCLNRASAAGLETYSCASIRSLGPSSASTARRWSAEMSSLRYTDSSAELLQSAPSRSRLAVTARKPPSTNNASAIVSVESRPAWRPRHRLVNASSRAYRSARMSGDLGDAAVGEGHGAAADAPNQFAVVRRDDNRRAARVDLAE